MPKRLTAYQQDIAKLEALGHDINKARDCFEKQFCVDLNRCPRGWRFYALLDTGIPGTCAEFLRWKTLDEVIEYLNDPHRIGRELAEARARAKWHEHLQR
jgi:hypothetical protein